uniref:Si946076e12 n=1 Tax=Arundo donax TaxID=35708 RepID=A0A0A9EEG0_ARUDO
MLSGESSSRRFLLCQLRKSSWLTALQL